MNNDDLPIWGRLRRDSGLFHLAGGSTAEVVQGATDTEPAWSTTSLLRVDSKPRLPINGFQNDICNILLLLSVFWKQMQLKPFRREP